MINDLITFSLLILCLSPPGSKCLHICFISLSVALCRHTGALSDFFSYTLKTTTIYSGRQQNGGNRKPQNQSSLLKNGFIHCCSKSTDEQHWILSFVTDKFSNYMLNQPKLILVFLVFFYRTEIGTATATATVSVGCADV